MLLFSSCGLGRIFHGWLHMESSRSAVSTSCSDIWRYRTKIRKQSSCTERRLETVLHGE